MVAAMPFTVCTARNSPATGAGLAGARSQSSSSWLQTLRCSRLSARNSSAYCERSMASAEDPLHRFEDARRLERLHDEVLRPRLDRFDLDRLRPRLRFTHDLETGLGQDVRDHRPHEDGVVADEDSVAHTPS